MINWMREHLAMSKQGAIDLRKGMVYSACSYLTLMIPMGIFMAFLNEVMIVILNGETIHVDLAKYIFIIIFAIILMIPFNYLQYGSAFIATYNESANKRISLAEKLKVLPLSFFDHRDISDLTTTIMSDTTGMEHAFSHALPQLGGAITFTVVSMIGCAIMNLKMAIALFWVFPISLCMIVGSKKLQDYTGRRHLKAKVVCADGIQECLENVRELKAYNYRKDYVASLYEKMDLAEEAQIKSELAMDAFLGMGQVFLRLGLASTIIVGAASLANGEIDLLTYFMFLMAATRIYDPLSGVLANISEIFNVRLKIERMQEIEKMPIQEGSHEYTLEGYDVNFDHVSFGYNDELVLKDVSFVVKQGEITALVGESGSGKSTAAKLAARFFDASEGMIRLGGIDVRSINPENLLENFSIVFQDVVLFNTSVMENIRIGKKDASDEEVMAAAKAAQCEEFINRLPDGYHTIIGENGAMLSGGERQRLSIARAILKDAPIILLDEATASLDVESETLVQEAISRLIKKKTVLIIAHRMRTIASADKIVVLHKGEIAEVGSPDELMKQDGMYKKMVELQRESQDWSI